MSHKMLFSILRSPISCFTRITCGGKIFWPRYENIFNHLEISLVLGGVWTSWCFEISGYHRNMLRHFPAFSLVSHSRYWSLIGWEDRRHGDMGVRHRASSDIDVIIPKLVTQHSHFLPLKSFFWLSDKLILSGGLHIFNFNKKNP